MGLSIAVRRLGGVLLTGALTFGGVVVGAGVADAATMHTFARAGWSSVDVTAPTTSFPGGSDDARVGSWFDENHKLHVTKVYFTMDLAPLQGSRILSGELFVRETGAADCTKDRATELWATDSADAPTWLNQPAQRTRLVGGNADSCPAYRIEWDATASIQDALAAGKTSLTLGMTMPADKLYNPAYSRSYANNLQITITYNRAPDVPTNLRYDIYDCADGPRYVGSGTAGFRLAAAVSDVDGDRLDAEFAIWPVDHPDQAYDVTQGFTYGSGTLQIGVPSGFFTDGETYDWHVRAVDDTDVSAWSPSCRFMIDDTPPATAPTITSTDYPPVVWSGGPGIPGKFTFDAKGDTDITGFYYGEWDAYTYVAADHPGGTATVTVTPTSSGPHRMVARGADAAGHRGPTSEYSYWVKEIRPEVDCTAAVAIGMPVTCTFRPNLPDVVSYTYTFADDQPVTVPAQPDGTATVTLVPQVEGQTPLKVTSTMATGATATSDAYVVLFPQDVVLEGITTDPAVNEPVLVQASSVVANTVSYTYRLDDGDPMTADADANGAAVLTVTPTTTGWHTIYVTGVTAEGYRTTETPYDFYIPES